MLEEVLALREKLHGENHVNVADALVNIAVLYSKKVGAERISQILNNT